MLSSFAVIGHTGRLIILCNVRSISSCRYNYKQKFLPPPNFQGHSNVRSYCQSIQNAHKESSQSTNDRTSSDKHDLNNSKDGNSSHDEGIGVDMLRIKILEASLPFVHKHGWSSEAISSGAQSLGYSTMAHGMFNEGGVELVNYFNKCCNQLLETNLKAIVTATQEKNLKSSTSVFIKEAIKERLKMNIKYMNTWPEAMALNAAPTNASNALFNIGTLVDHIWYYAGDRTNDFNWYTKRGIVALVYKSTELCMVQDKSIDYKDTWEFLDRRLEDVYSAAKCFKDANNYTKDISNIAQAGIATALNILGMNKKSR